MMNASRLVILGALMEGSKHGYEIQRFIRDRGMDLWSSILPGSVYFALNKMEEEDLVRAEAEERTGNRLRKTYAITDEGRAAFLDLLREALAGPPHPFESAFPLGFLMAKYLGAKERAGILRRNIAALEKSFRFRESVRPRKGRLDPALDDLLSNELAVFERDLELLKSLVSRAEKEGEGKAERRKATHLLIRYTGAYRGNAYTYEETVPIGRYEGSQWWLRFKPKEVADVFRSVSDAKEGDMFTIDDPRSKTRTTMWAIVEVE